MRREDLAHAIDLIGDVLLPAGRGRPAPSEVRLGDDLLNRLRDSEKEMLRQACEELGAPGRFETLDGGSRHEALATLEQNSPRLFDAVRRCVYFGYYAQPAVIRVLRAQGYDINEAPQPRGYAMPPMSPEVVKNVDRSRRVWIPAEEVGTRIKEAS
ncbi:hypothetical protein [Microbacterium sp. NPDC077184]|uniref:hypothetical protein n=1 Tax=Microbacterium sp. NPDC077184 TaxID=3154764 RepID=UPI00343BCFE0